MTTPRIRLGDLSVGFLQSLGDAMRDLGHDPRTLLEQYGFDAARLAQPRARLSIPRYMRLGHSAIQATGEAGLGLAMGRLSRLSQIGLAGIAAAQAPTVREAARTLIRFEPLYAANYRGHSSLHEDSRGAWLRFYSISPYNAYNRFVVDSVIAGWLQQLSTVAGSALLPQAVQIEFPAPAYATQYATQLGCAVEFDAPHNQLRLRQQALNLRNPEHSPGTWQHLLELCEQELQQLTRTRSLRERVSQLLGPLLHGREPDMRDIARRLQLPSWTLRRRLAEEGTQFRSILNETRRDLAIAYVRDTELAFGEIAYLLGFASAEAFQRAFKRWLQQTPGEARRGYRRPDGLASESLK
ncbi:AraC family transcriptional regulator [Phytopseudomonas dryadis]|uniref:AraC family transcriptional regulator n=1 Tax=Phytopseudomonas dryadis TaxID=2487520 RepID=A0A4Q9QYP4_9GAMM|nr:MULTISPECIES: AraC family transcriptional regulator [Pseudomonas]TBU90604.1 AraC family transcriptional regulator [Pseudomonas dryadis]TBV03777.1 AraC family transcriptional regulator [Pseudomonas dryadis]TBV15994.1 AraC family transcriptional regulator [Pseudomonas sp. FRB 230]